ncbi:MAG: hypothetical protein ACKER6_00910 [Candidatus Hodgkinia cicadicola]
MIQSTGRSCGSGKLKAQLHCWDSITTPHSRPALLPFGPTIWPLNDFAHYCAAHLQLFE